MPSKVTFSDGGTIAYSYATDGTKLRTVHVINGTTTTKDYCANVVYENGVQKMLLTEEGYVDLSASTPTYYYYLKDHQGNNRVVINSSGTVQETNHYYPFGGVFASTGNVQPYKYNGKELDTKKGLNWYDYGARHCDATLGRWFVVDPLAERMYSWSPYAYCYDNPIKFIDVDGKYGESIWDVSSFLIGVKSLTDNIKSRNIGSAIVDGVGIVLDAVAIALPGVPGGVSSGIKAVRNADNLVDAVNAGNKVDNAVSAKKFSKEGLKIEISKENKIDRNLLDKSSKPDGAPTFKSDGKKVEIHHEGQNPNGPFKEMHKNEHRGKKNYKKNHPNINRPSKIDRREFDKARKEY